MNAVTCFEPLVNDHAYEEADEMISLLDQLHACMDLSRSLMLHVCSNDMRGRTLDLAAGLETELAVLQSQAQHFARHI